MNWTKSSKCESAHCVEASPCADTACVEVKASDAFTGMIVLRSSQRPEDTILVDRAEWTAFLAGAKAGDFDHLVQ